LDFFLRHGFVLFYGRHAESETLHLLQLNMLALMGSLTSGVPSAGGHHAPRHRYGMPALQKHPVSSKLSTKLQPALHPPTTSTTLPCLHSHPSVFSLFPQQRHSYRCHGLKPTHENAETTQAIGHFTEEPFGSSIQRNRNERHCNAKRHLSRIHSLVLSELKASL